MLKVNSASQTPMFFIIFVYASVVLGSVITFKLVKSLCVRASKISAGVHEFHWPSLSEIGSIVKGKIFVCASVNHLEESDFTTSSGVDEQGEPTVILRSRNPVKPIISGQPYWKRRKNASLNEPFEADCM